MVAVAWINQIVLLYKLVEVFHVKQVVEANSESPEPDEVQINTLKKVQ